LEEFDFNNLAIRIYGCPVHKKKASPVEKIDGKLKLFGDKLLKFMMKYDGVGLAAPQMGGGVRMIALSVPRPDPSKLNRPLSPGEELLGGKMPASIINPEILFFSEEKGEREEGCLSVPGIFANVERPAKIIFRGLVNYEEDITVECAGLLARAIQHEIDHLDGILFVDRLDKKSFSKIKKKLELLKKEAVKNDFIRTDKGV
jgi:peptide deformylase